MDEEATRSLRAAALFDVNVTEVTHNVELKQLMWKWEKLKNKQTRIWWDAATLKTYVEKSIIPRGLRMNKMPTSVQTDTFMVEWNSVLSDCSIKLMKLLIQQEEAALVTLK